MYFSKQNKVKHSTKFSSLCHAHLTWVGVGAAGAGKSVQRNNVWYDAEDGCCVRAAPVCDGVAMALP